MKRNTILIIGLLGYLTYLIKYTSAFQYFPTSELLLPILFYGVIIIAIMRQLFTTPKGTTKFKKIQKKPKTKKATTTVITPFNRQFKKNYKKVNKRYTHKEDVPDEKSEYIQSLWDEIK